jgi:hypothetical protein
MATMYSYLLGPDGNYYISGYGYGANPSFGPTYEEIILIPDSVVSKYISKKIPNNELEELVKLSKSIPTMKSTPDWYIRETSEATEILTKEQIEQQRIIFPIVHGNPEVLPPNIRGWKKLIYKGTKSQLSSIKTIKVVGFATISIAAIFIFYSARKKKKGK